MKYIKANSHRQQDKVDTAYAWRGSCTLWNHDVCDRCRYARIYTLCSGRKPDGRGVCQSCLNRF